MLVGFVKFQQITQNKSNDKKRLEIFIIFLYFPKLLFQVDCVSGPSIEGTFQKIVNLTKTDVNQFLQLCLINVIFLDINKKNGVLKKNVVLLLKRPSAVLGVNVQRTKGITIRASKR